MGAGNRGFQMAVESTKDLEGIGLAINQMAVGVQEDLDSLDSRLDALFTTLVSLGGDIVAIQARLDALENP